LKFEGHKITFVIPSVYLIVWSTPQSNPVYCFIITVVYSRREKLMGGTWMHPAAVGAADIGAGEAKGPGEVRSPLGSSFLHDAGSTRWIRTAFEIEKS